MDNFFSIGEVSKYQNISKQTLIFYDKIGLFCPAYVDPNNGYRYYSSKQLDYLDTILIMKKIGFSLREIQEYMKHYTIEKSLSALKSQLSILDGKIQELTLIRSRLEHRLKQMEKAKKYKDQESEPYVEKVKEQHILFQEVKPPYNMEEISIATKKCFAKAFKEQLPAFFQCGVCVPLSRIQKEHFTEASLAFLPVEPTEKAQNIQKLPSGKCASIYHVGNYASIGQSYRKLLNYIKAMDLEIISDSYEFCINDYITSRDENEYITKISFYIRP